MTIIPQVATALHEVLNTIATTLGRSTDFVQRECKLNGALFVQTLVFTFLANPEATGHSVLIVSASQEEAVLFLPVREASLTHWQAARTILG